MGKEKIKAEMAANKKNGYFQVIGTFLLDHLEQNPSDQSKLADEKKSIKGSLEAMEKVAKKQKQGNVSVIDPEQGFKIVSDYFGLSSKPNGSKATKSEVTPERKEEPSSGFQASLSDFL